jgi:L-malate glycosyltransferase
VGSHRVCYLIGQLCRGGAEQQLYYLLRNLRHQATVVSMYSGGYWAAPIRELGHTVHELDSKRRFEFGRLRKIFALIRNPRPDIIHVFHTGMNGLYGQVAAVIAGHNRVIVNVRSDPASYPEGYRSIWRQLNRRALAVVCNNRAAYDRLLVGGLAQRNNLHLIHNGIDLRPFRPSPTPIWPWPPSWSGKRIVVMATRLEAVKNPVMFLELAAKVKKLYPDTRFALVGDGRMRKQLEQKACSLQLTDVLLMPGERTDIPSLFQAASVFVLTSNHEGSPNAILEAMAAGLPCVTTNAGGCAELVSDSETGFVIPVGNLAALVARVSCFLRHADKRIEMGKQGRFRLEQKFSVRAMVERYTSLYAQAVSRQSLKTTQWL